MIFTTLIEIPQWHTFTIIEAIWLFSGLLALAISGFRLRPLLNDLAVARKTGERDLYVIARGYLRRELVRVGQALCIVGIGVYSASEPPAIPGPAVVSIVGLVITAVLLVISFLVSLQSYLDWRDREEVRKILGEYGGNNS